MADDPLTSVLDEYAAFFEAEAAREKQGTWHVGAARRRGERLLAAVDEVLKIHAPALFAHTGIEVCRQCLPWGDDSLGRVRWPCTTYEAITRALTGEDAS